MHELSRAIQREYERRGDRLGWRLLYSPEVVLAGADVAFIGLNPGGDREYAEHPRFSTEHGSAYETEVWKQNKPAGEAPLQRQVRALFSGLGVSASDVLAGNFVPFRSPEWSALQNRPEALRFSANMVWRPLFSAIRPSLVIGMGKGVLGQELSALLETGPLEPVEIGWGRVAAQRARGRHGQLVVLPHLSRFGFITRRDSRAALRRLFGSRWCDG